MNKRIRLPLLAMLLPIAAPALADSSTASTAGLGQSWPATADVSASGHFHVYQFERAGVRYVQINDLNGIVRAAFGVAGGQVFALPMGADTTRLATASQAASAPAQDANGETVYRSDDVQVIAYPQPSGTVIFQAIQGECTKGPEECGAHFNATSPSR